MEGGGSSNSQSYDGNVIHVDQPKQTRTGKEGRNALIGDLLFRRKFSYVKALFRYACMHLALRMGIISGLAVFEAFWKLVAIQED